jgi:predicted DNA-binding transcriptional regulator AlpA
MFFSEELANKCGYSKELEWRKIMDKRKFPS